MGIGSGQSGPKQNGDHLTDRPALYSLIQGTTCTQSSAEHHSAGARANKEWGKNHTFALTGNPSNCINPSTSRNHSTLSLTNNSFVGFSLVSCR